MYGTVLLNDSSFSALAEKERNNIFVCVVTTDFKLDGNTANLVCQWRQNQAWCNDQSIPCQYCRGQGSIFGDWGWSRCNWCIITFSSSRLPTAWVETYISGWNRTRSPQLYYWDVALAVSVTSLPLSVVTSQIGNGRKARIPRLILPI